MIDGRYNKLYQKLDLCRIEYNPKQPEIFHVCDASDPISNEARQFGWRVIATNQPFYIINAFIDMCDKEVFIDNEHVTFLMMKDIFNDWIGEVSFDN